MAGLGVIPKSRIPHMDVSVEEIRRIENRVGHDVKAIELYIRKSLKKAGARELAPFVHLGLTSEDTNSLAFALLLKSAKGKILVPAYGALALQLAKLASTEAETVMAARTHGRPAVPTTFGKEMAVFAIRLAERTSRLESLVPMAKFSGAVGTYASFGLIADLDWPKVLGDFVSRQGVESSRYSTQVVPGERLSEILHCFINMNQLMISLSRDLWLYQALGFVRFTRPGKISSSTMPQKVNPVDLENAEGQAEVSNSLLIFIAYRLEHTRMQRDMSDSVVRRMIGQGLAHSYVSCLRLASSLRSMRVERLQMIEDVKAHPEIMAEMEQIKMRIRGSEYGYEEVKKSIEKGELPRSGGSPETYLGIAPELAKDSTRVVRSIIEAGKNKGKERRTK